jgi:hypothetical protein
MVLVPANVTIYSSYDFKEEIAYILTSRKNYAI